MNVDVATPESAASRFGIVGQVGDHADDGRVRGGQGDGAVTESGRNRRLGADDGNERAAERQEQHGAQQHEHQRHPALIAPH